MDNNERVVVLHGDALDQLVGVAALLRRLTGHDGAMCMAAAALHLHGPRVESRFALSEGRIDLEVEGEPVSLTVERVHEREVLTIRFRSPSG